MSTRLNARGQTSRSRAFNLVLIDGNHEQDYLANEFAALRDLLADACLVVFDDVGDFAGVSQVFKQAVKDGSVEELGEDGRVGIVRTRARAMAGDRGGSGQHDANPSSRADQLTRFEGLFSHPPSPIPADLAQAALRVLELLLGRSQRHAFQPWHEAADRV